MGLLIDQNDQKGRPFCSYRSYLHYIFVVIALLILHHNKYDYIAIGTCVKDTSVYSYVASYIVQL